MVTVRVIDRIVLTFGNIGCKWLALVIIGGFVVISAVLSDKILYERVWAGCEVRRVAQSDNIFVRAAWKAFNVSNLV